MYIAKVKIYFEVKRTLKIKINPYLIQTKIKYYWVPPQLPQCKNKLW